MWFKVIRQLYSSLISSFFFCNYKSIKISSNWKQLPLWGNLTLVGFCIIMSLMEEEFKKKKSGFGFQSCYKPFWVFWLVFCSSGTLHAFISFYKTQLGQTPVFTEIFLSLDAHPHTWSISMSPWHSGIRKPLDFQICALANDMRQTWCILSYIICFHLHEISGTGETVNIKSRLVVAGVLGRLGEGEWARDCSRAQGFFWRWWKCSGIHISDGCTAFWIY